MPRHRQYKPLRVLLNGRPVGDLLKELSGAMSFHYDGSWLSWAQAVPISLSLPLREDPYKGAPVVAVFENLLPDSDRLRQRVAEKVGAEGTDAYSLLSRIGRDCVGALQFIPFDADVEQSAGITGEEISEAEIQKLLLNLTQAPLGLERDQDFRISIAGAQDKTALLWHNDRWWKPHGATPTTHILKKQIGTLPNGLDLSNSVENEFYCIKLLAAFGLPVNDVEMATFGKTKALIIERFDRRWTTDGRLIRLPQEDCCQALSVPPSRKYQNDGGPGMVEILQLLKASDVPEEDQKLFLKAQIIFWLIGATDGHAKNFSIFLGPAGQFHLTPLYDVISAQPSLAARQIHQKQMKLAMFVGNKRHYALEYIQGRHFVQTAERGGLRSAMAMEALEEIAARSGPALASVANQLPKRFPGVIHDSIRDGMLPRLKSIG